MQCLESRRKGKRVKGEEGERKRERERELGVFVIVQSDSFR